MPDRRRVEAGRTLLALAIWLPLGAGTYLLALCGMHVISFGLLATLLGRGGGVTAAGIAQAVWPPLAAAALAYLTAPWLGGPWLLARAAMFGSCTCWRCACCLRVRWRNWCVRCRSRPG